MNERLKIIAALEIIFCFIGGLILLESSALLGFSLIVYGLINGIFILAFAELLESVNQIKKNTSSKNDRSTYSANELPTL